MVELIQERGVPVQQSMTCSKEREEPNAFAKSLHLLRRCLEYITFALETFGSNPITLIQFILGIELRHSLWKRKVLEVLIVQTHTLGKSIHFIHLIINH